MVLTQKFNIEKAVRIDGILWHVIGTGSSRTVHPICPIHHLRMYSPRASVYDRHVYSLKCAECKTLHSIPRNYNSEKSYILDKIDSKIFKDMPVINLDDEAIPLAEKKIHTQGDPYFVTGLLVKSKVGHRLVVYAGKKGGEKTQIFVEPDIKRLAFDQNNLHPCEVFVALEATFDDGSKHTLVGAKESGKITKKSNK